MAKTHIRLQDLSLSYTSTPLITKLNITVSSGQCAVIVGENGRGKTTLLRALAREFPPSAGEILTHGTVAIAHQHMPAGDLSVGEICDEAIRDSKNALEELERAGALLETNTAHALDGYQQALDAAEVLDAWNAEHRLEKALRSFGAITDRSRALSELSIGQRYRVRLACLIGGDADILLLDEPTNHLDRGALNYLTEAITSHKGVVLVVSHDQALIKDVADFIIDIDSTPDGLPRIYHEGFDSYRRQRSALLETWRQDYAAAQTAQQQLQEDLEHARQRVNSSWKPPKGTGKHTRASRAPGVVQALKRAQDALDSKALDVPPAPAPLLLPTLKVRPDKPMVDFSDLFVPHRLRLPGSHSVLSGDKIVISGDNGAGKSTLIEVLSGALTPASGSVANHARTGVLGQESHVGEVPSIARDHAVKWGLLSVEESRFALQEFSIGQRRRLDLAMSLAGNPELLLLDEPSNHLSMHLVSALTEWLDTTAAAVIMVTHDRQLLRDTAHWRHIELKS